MNLPLGGSLSHWMFVFRVLAMLSLLAWCSRAHADDAAGGGAAGPNWPMWAAAVVQVVIALTVGFVQAGYSRTVRLADERIAAQAARIDSLEQLVRATREDYARRADMEAAMASMSAQLRELRTDVGGDVQQLRDEVSRDVAQLRTDIGRGLQEAHTDIRAINASLERSATQQGEILRLLTRLG